MPKLGLTMTEGSVSEWTVTPGSTYKKGECLLVIETDKITNEVAADEDGELIEILVPAGVTVAVGTVLAYWKSANSDGTTVSQQPAATTGAKSTEASVPQASTAKTAAPVVTALSPVTRIIASPLAKRLASQQALDLGAITGTGPKGRIVARDIQNHISVSAQTAKNLDQQPSMPEPTSSGYVVQQPTPGQLAVAKRLTVGKQETPHFYLALEADVTNLLALRKEINRDNETNRLTINHFLVKAVAAALNLLPDTNRTWSAEGIRCYSQIDVGIAINTAHGLLAPAAINIGNLGIGQIAHAVDAVITRARNNRLTQADMGTPAITISNAGMHNVTYMSSIINPGQAMILGVGSIKGVFRPDDSGQPVLRQEMGLVLSADHRVMDGVSALEFLNRIVSLLEQPAKMLLN